MRRWTAAAVIGLLAGCFGDPAASDCEDGQIGCACAAGETCDGDLTCDLGTCVPPGCSAGALGCPCNDGACTEGSCVDNTCVAGGGTGTSNGGSSGAPTSGGTVGATSNGTTGVGPGDSTGITPTDSGGPDCALDRHFVFVTGSMHTGDLGGPEGADEICTTEAVPLGIAGVTWKAVIATAGAAANERIEICADVELVPDGGGSTDLVATPDTWWTTTHTHPINRRPDMTVAPGTVFAWTGMADASGAPGDHCDGFTTGAAQGNAGDPNSANDWANYATISPVTCGNPYALYCISQPQ